MKMMKVSFDLSDVSSHLSLRPERSRTKNFADAQPVVRARVRMLFSFPCSSTSNNSSKNEDNNKDSRSRGLVMNEDREDRKVDLAAPKRNPADGDGGPCGEAIALAGLVLGLAGVQRNDNDKEPNPNSWTVW